MNVLTDALPSGVWIENEWYPIDTDFRTWIAFEIMIQDHTGEQGEFSELVMGMLFKDVFPKNIVEAMDAIANFYRCGEISQKDDGEKSDRLNEPCYSFKYDAGYIFSAFLQQYNIDLTETKMHWWKFRALFSGLSEACTIVKIMGYRSADTRGDMSKAEREHIKRMQMIYALPRPKNMVKEEDELARILMGDGDLSEYRRKMERMNEN
ncbi:MAG: bacteriophage Gp15 family protein [Eubacterium sp.]